MSTIQEALRKAKRERDEKGLFPGASPDRGVGGSARRSRGRGRLLLIAAPLVVLLAVGVVAVSKMGWLGPWSPVAIWQSLFASKETRQTPQKEVAQAPPGRTGKAARGESPSPATTGVSAARAPQGQPAQPASGTAKRQGEPPTAPAPQPVARAAPARTPPQSPVASPPPTQASAPTPKPSGLQEARRLQLQGDLRGAEMILKALVEKDPKMTEAMTALANLYLRDLQEPQKALPLYERVLALEPGRASFQVNLGVYYLKSGDRAKAREQFNKAVALDPKLAEAHYNLACLYAVEGKRGEAEQALRRAVEADPRSAQWAKEDPDLALLRTSP